MQPVAIARVRPYTVKSKTEKRKGEGKGSHLVGFRKKAEIAVPGDYGNPHSRSGGGTVGVWRRGMAPRSRGRRSADGGGSRGRGESAKQGVREMMKKEEAPPARGSSPSARGPRPKAQDEKKRPSELLSFV